MSKIIAAIDGSAYADSVCALGAWAAERCGYTVSLLHVVASRPDEAAKWDLSGQIGLGAKSDLLGELTRLDEEHGRLEQKKGQLMLDHARQELKRHGVTPAEILHRRGSLVENVTELEAGAELIVMGKRGEHHHSAAGHLGSNLERVARAIHKPLLVAARKAVPVRRFLIAYDGGPSTRKAVDYAIANPLLQGLDCHLLTVGDATPEKQKILNEATEKLKAAGFTVHNSLAQGRAVEDIMVDYIAAHDIGLLVIGAYGHSKIRSLILGSTTTELIRKAKIPVLLFR